MFDIPWMHISLYNLWHGLQHIIIIIIIIIFIIIIIIK
jgi:hypothetical protein